MNTFISQVQYELLNYKKNSVEDRVALLNKRHQILVQLNLKTKATIPIVIELFKEWVLTAMLLTYAKILFAIEHQGYFGILADFYQMPLDPILSAYFEFGSPVLMRLKKPFEEIPSEIYHSFRASQKHHLIQIGKSAWFNLDELDIDHPPLEQLFPVQIQMMGALYNQAVDRVHVSKDGHFNLVQRQGKIFLPGGGMLERDLHFSKDLILEKILQEYIEEEQANFYRIGRNVIDIIPKSLFQMGLQSYSRWQALVLREDMLPGDILSSIIKELDSDLKQCSDFQKQAQLFHLRASIQWKVFKMTSCYQKAMKFLHEQPEIFSIPMFLDIRALGGFQISNTLILPDLSLEQWFSKELGVNVQEFGDDLTHARSKPLTFFEVLEQYQDCVCSHLLILLAAIIYDLEHGVRGLDIFWQPTNFLAITQRLQTDIKHFISYQLA